jgi:hypothetical protein
MAIPQPQMLYTGENVPVPDWKSFNKELNARMDMIRREKQQQRQWEQQRQDAINREFLKTVDIDKVNLGDAILQQKALDEYKKFDEIVTSLVEAKGKKGEELSIQDIMNARAVASKVEQKIGMYKVWENKRQLDIKAYMADPGKFNKEHFKNNTLEYKGDPYTESRLKLAEWNTKTLATNMENDLKWMPKQSFSYYNGNVKVSGSFSPAYWKFQKIGNQFKPELDENGYPKPNYEAQGKALKTLLNTPEYIQGRKGIIKRFNKLSSDEQKYWNNRALDYKLTTTIDGETQGDGELLYALEGEGLSNVFNFELKRNATKPSRTSGKTEKKVLDVRIEGNIQDAPVKLEGEIEGALDKKGEKIVVHDGSITQIKFMKNPSTGQEEWMAIGTYDKQLPFEEKVFYGSGKQPETFLVPYKNIEEPFERHYTVIGMNEKKNKKEENQEKKKGFVWIGE